jgi:hypothetical protein
MSQNPIKFEIVVNGSKKTWDHEKISYSEVVQLAYPGQHGDNEVFTVTYSKGPPQNPQGSLVQGKSVFVKNGMVFDVTRTVQS